MNFALEVMKAIGAALNSVTHFELVFVDHPQGSGSSSSSSDIIISSSSGTTLVSYTSYIVSTFSRRCPMIKTLCIHVRLQVTNRQRKAVIPSQHLRVADLVSESGLQLLTRLTRLEIAVHMCKGATLCGTLLLPLNDADLRSFAGCTRLLHLSVQARVNTDLNWQSLPNALESLELLEVIQGPRLGTCLPNLRQIKIELDCAAKDLVLLLQCSPVIQRVQLRDLVAVTLQDRLGSLHTVQELNSPAVTVNAANSSHFNVLADGVSSVDGGGSPAAAMAVAGWSTSLPKVQARRIKLVIPQAGGLTFSAFLQQMQPMLGFAFCSFARRITGPMPAPAGPVDPFMTHIARAFPDVRSLLVEHCTLVDADFMLLNQCTKLQAVHLGGCSGLTETGFVGLAKEARELLVLQAHGWSSVSISAKRTVHATLQPRLVGPKLDEKHALMQVQSSQKCRVYYRAFATARLIRMVVRMTCVTVKAWLRKSVLKIFAVRVLQVPRARACRTVDVAFDMHDRLAILRQLQRWLL